MNKRRGGAVMTYLDKMATYVIGGAGSIYAFVTDHTEQGFQILLLMMVVDIVSGLLKGAQNKRLKSAIMSMGIIKKGAILLSVAFGYILDNAINGGQPVFSTMMTWLAIGNEGLSVIENLQAMGVKIPTAVSDKLGQLNAEAKELQAEKDEIKK
jgi:toxin secretion/phage lysis holin